MALPTYGLLGAGSAMLQAPPGQGLGQTVGRGLSGFLSGTPVDLAQQQQEHRRKTLEDVRQAWLAGAKPIARQHAVPISYLSGVSKAESNDRNIPQQINDTGSAFGPFQFTEGTWRDQITRHPELGLSPQDRFNPAAQGRVAVTFTRDNRDALRSALNRDPSPGELLLAHRFGAQGAISLLNTPRGSSVATALPAAVAANPQWAKMTVAQILDETNRAVGSQPKPKGGGGLLGSSPTPTPGSSTSGMAALFGGVPLAPIGTPLESMTPEFRNILSIALQDPTLGPAALQTILQAGLSGGGGRAGAKPTDKILNALAAGLQPGTPEFQRALVGGEEGVKPTDIMKEAEALYPNDPAAQRTFIENYRAKAGVQVQVNPTTSIDTGQAKPVNEAVQKRYEAAIAGGDLARNKLAQLDAAETALANVPTGKGAETLANISGYLQAFGVDPSKLGLPASASAAQVMSAIINPMVLELRNPSGGAGMPGALSDKDREFLTKSTVGLENTPQANAAIIMLQRRLSQRQLDLENLAIAHTEAHDGTVAPTFLREVRDYANANPLFGPEFRKRYESLVKSSVQPVTSMPQAAPAPAAGPPTINDQKAYDALPSGTTYQSGGKLYRKP